MSRRSERDAERIVWVGHATVVLELGSARLITDPVLRNRIVHLRRRAPAPAPAELEDLDAVLISHLHLDHLDVPSLRRLGRGAPLIVPRGAGGMLVRLGFCDITELAVGESVDIRGVTVTAVPADHDGHRRPHGPFAHPVGFVVTGARQVYFAGDTALFEDMAHLGGALDVALLPIWGWGPTLGPGHLSPRGAAEALVLLRPAVAVPVHWGTFFPAGLARLHPAALVEPPRAFVREAARFAPGVRVRVLEPGEALSLSPAPS